MSYSRSYKMRSLLAGIVVWALSLSGLLVGCASNDQSVARVFGGFNMAPHTAPDTSGDYAHFRDVFITDTKDDGTRDTQLKHFGDAFSRVRRDYVREVEPKFLYASAIAGIEDAKGKAPKVQLSPENAMEAALDNMLSSLDPHSSYLNPQEYRESQVVTSGQFGGLGIEINSDNENSYIKVIAPIADTPAERAGIKSGDMIIEVDGQDIKGMKLEDAVKLLRGEPKTNVKLKLRRDGTGDVDVLVQRAIIQIDPVKYWVENDVGYIRVTHFISRTEEALNRAMRRIRAEDGSNLKGIVLDLRDNPGGLLTQSIAVADAFLNDGKILSVRDREGEMRRWDAQNGDLARGLPMVVLINRGSASASEIVAGALQDQHRAVVMGVRSFGKGSVQTITPLEWDGALRLTTALYYLPSGRTIQGMGVMPDIGVTGPEEKDARRESDLPHAFASGDPATETKTRLTLDESVCPLAGQKKDDRLLGCALTYLQLGNDEKFVASLGARKPG